MTITALLLLKLYAFLWQQRSVCQDQQLIIPAEKNTLSGHSGYHSYSSSKHFPNYSFRNSHVIHAAPAELPIHTGRRPKSCMHCTHLFSNGAPKFGSIHSMLAYAKCRCHRPDTSNKLQSLRENHSESTSGSKLFKRVAFAHAAKDSPQTVLPSLTKDLDRHSEQPLIESSSSELATSNSQLPTLKRYNDIIMLYECEGPK